MYQYSQGKHNTQGHKGIPAGFYEEEQGRKGFFGPVSHLIKPEASTKWTNIVGPLRPHLFDLVEMNHESGKWQRLFFNNDVVIYSCWNNPTSLNVGQNLLDSFRNADGDLLLFCHIGSGSSPEIRGNFPRGRKTIPDPFPLHSISASDVRSRCGPRQHQAAPGNKT